MEPVEKRPVKLDFWRLAISKIKGGAVIFDKLRKSVTAFLNLRETMNVVNFFFCFVGSSMESK